MKSDLLQNYPLFLRTVSPEEELKFHYTVHTSLDVVEEKGEFLNRFLSFAIYCK